MSQVCRRLIRQMLQTDPKKRITIKELLQHPWLTMGISDPIPVDVENSKQRDNDCLLVMCKHYGVDMEDLWSHLKKWNFDYETATYLLLQLRKQRRLPLRLLNIASKSMFTLESKVMYLLVKIN